MSTDILLPSAGAMEGGGAYNTHARLQATAASLALPLLFEAVWGVSFEPGERPLVVADYGSSQGKNSLVPIGVALSALRERAGAERPVQVFHIDQPENDFNTLFQVLNQEERRYTASDPHVFPAAIGKSFYNPVLPPDSVDFGWCSYAAIWLSRAPALIPGHLVAIRSDNGVRSLFEQQARADWERFLALRNRELRRGARLVVVLPGIDENGVTGLEEFFDHGNSALISLEADGLLHPEERARMVLPAYPRQRPELEAPIHNGALPGLALERYEMEAFLDPAWTVYLEDNDARALALKRAQLFRATFIPTLAAALSPNRSSVERERFAEVFTERLTERIAANPDPMRSYVQTLVFAKS